MRILAYTNAISLPPGLDLVAPSIMKGALSPILFHPLLLHMKVAQVVGPGSS